MVKHLKAATALLLTLLLVLSAGMVGINPHLSAQDEVTALAAVNTEEEWDLVKQQHQVSTVSPSNATINLFDYWLTGRNDAEGVLDGTGNYVNTDNLREVYTNGINANHALLFRRQIRTAWWNHDSSGQQKDGIVQNVLGSDGYPVLNLTETDIQTGDSHLVGRDPNESLAYLFDPNNDNDGDGYDGGKLSFSNVQGFLQLDEETGEYFYDSSQYFADFDEENNSFSVYDVNANKSEEQEQDNIGFFPFVDVDQVFEADIDENNTTTMTAKDEYAQERTESQSLGTTHKDLNHYFGFTLEVDFQQPIGGLVNENEAMTFHFSGDDDVWIFIDGVLVADLGGIHGRQSVDIDFSTGAITYDGRNTTNTTLRAQFEAAGRYDADNFNGDTFTSSAIGEGHVLQMFYLERGHADSNMELRYNLVHPVNSQIIKLDQNGDPVEGATFALYEANSDYAYSESNLIASGLTTNANGEVELVYQNGDHRGEAIEFVNGQHYVLKETSIPEGYESPQNSASDGGEIWLYCETFHENQSGGDYTQDGTNLLLVDEQSIWETGAVSNITVTVTQNATDLSYSNVYGGNSGTVDDSGKENGLILAVPWLRENDGEQTGGADQYTGMTPIYGSNLDGYHFAVDELNSTDNLELLQAAFQAAMYQIYYARYGEDMNYQNWYMAWYNSEDRYYGTLTDLPGDATRYIWTQDGDAVDTDRVDLSVAYYFLDWNDLYSIFGAENAAGTAAEKLSAMAGAVQREMDGNGGDLEQAVQTLMNRVIDADDGSTPGHFGLLESDSYTRQFAMRLYLPNVVRQLQVQKVDSSGQALAGATFTLSGSNGSAVGTTDENGLLVFSAKGTGAAGSAFLALEPGTYTLTETAAPEGYQINSTPVTIQVTEHEIYADAGNDQDGIAVRKGLGKLVQSMVRYTNDVNVTLRDITATQTTATGSITSGNTSNLDGGFTATGNTLALHYGLHTAYLEYGTHVDEATGVAADPFFETQTGTIGLEVAQNDDVHLDDEYFDSRSRDVDLSGFDISNLFSGSTTVVVTNRANTDGTGTLTVQKEVLTPEQTGAEGAFPFTLAFANAGESLAGSYDYAIYWTGKVRASGTLTLDDSGNIQWVTVDAAGTEPDLVNETAHTFTLKDGYYFSVEGLPAGAVANVAEQGSEGKTYQVYVTADAGDRSSGSTLSGSGSSVSGTVSVNSSQGVTGLPQADTSYEFEGSLADSSGAVGTVTADNPLDVVLSDGWLTFHQGDAASKNTVQWNNPLAGDAGLEGFAVSLLMKPNATVAVNGTDGLFSFTTQSGGYLGLAGNGTLVFSDGSGTTYDFTQAENYRGFLEEGDGEFLLTMTISHDRVCFYKNSVLVNQIRQADLTDAPDLFRQMVEFVRNADSFTLGSAAGQGGTAGFSVDFVRIYDSALAADQINRLAAAEANEAYLLFENVELADLEFEKDTVYGTDTPESGYPFTVTMTLPDGVPSGSYSYTVDQTATSISLTNGTATFDLSLGDGQSCVISNVPVGTGFRIGETADGYYTTITAQSGSGWTSGNAAVGSTPVAGSEAAGSLTASGAELTFTNRQATLTVTKRDGAGSLLENAGFTLYDSTGAVVVGEEQTVALHERVTVEDASQISNGRITVDGETYIVQNQVGGVPFYYRPLTEAEIQQYHEGNFANAENVEAVLIFTGLDPEESYVLRETSTPTGYVQAGDVTIAIDADVDLDLIRVVENHRNVVLPDTGWNVFLFGGMGFLLVAAGVVLLLTRRKKAGK